MRPPTRLDFYLSTDPAATFDRLVRAELLIREAPAQRDEWIASMREALREAREAERQLDRPLRLGELSPVARIVCSFFDPVLNETAHSLAGSLMLVQFPPGMAPPPTRLHRYIRDHAEETFESLRTNELLERGDASTRAAAINAMREALQPMEMYVERLQRRCALETASFAFLNARGRELTVVPITEEEGERF